MKAALHRSRLRPQPALASLALLLSLWVGGARPMLQAQEPEEYRVKAAFLFHFAQLVDWPAETDMGRDHSLLVCTLGEDPFHGVLENMIAGKTVGNRTIRIRHLKRADSAPVCQILFLGKDESTHEPSLLAALHNAPVLTVGETDSFLNAGGMICFLLKESKVRFAINLGAAESAHLKIGSRLLILAQNLAQEGRGK